jgi:hypothetical protein
MPTLVAPKETNKSIRRMVGEVKNASFEHKIHARSNRVLLYTKIQNQLKHNAYVNKLTKSIINHAALYNRIIKEMEELTWLTLNESDLKILNDLIAFSRDIYSTEMETYNSTDVMIKWGISKEVINKYRDSVETFKETYEDLESIFFFLPNNADFIEVTKELATL